MENMENDAMQLALQNPLILQNIFQNESAPGKTLRLVCHFWNDIVLSLRPPKLALGFIPISSSLSSVPSDCSSATQFELFCSNMDPKLARCIGQDPCLSNRRRSHRILCSAETKLLHVSEHFSQLVEDWTITFAGKDVIPTLYKILKSFCPNLTRLQIWAKGSIHDDRLNRWHYRSQDALPLCVRPKLTCVEIHDDFENSGFLEMTQLILNSAPSLTHLNYRGEKFPDLSRHLTLKSITLDMDRMKPTTSFTGDHGLNKMLDQVKDHLEFLHIWGTSPPNVDAASIDFKLPKMKKLKEFRNNKLDFFHCGDQLQDICSARIPTLETLELFKCKGTLDDLVQDIKQKVGLFRGVKNLHLAEVNDPESIIGLTTAFSSLEVLSIQQLHQRNDAIIEVGPHLRACASLGLQYLELGVANHPVNLSTFLQGFSPCGEFVPGLKNLEIRLFSRMFDDLRYVADGMGQMKEFLLGMKGLKNVFISGILLREETWKWVEPFIAENKIPIEFDKKFLYFLESI